VASSKALRSGVRAELIAQDPKQLEELIIEELIAQRPARQGAGIEDINEAELAQSYVKRALSLKNFITDTVTYLNKQLRSQKSVKILAEGAQAYWLDVDHGMYPFTTSTSTTSGGVSPGLGVPPTFINKIIGVAKAVQSHVGDGPFVTEVTNPKLAARLHGDMTTVDAERGTTTGRTRRLGHLDLAQIRRSIMVNGTHELALSKLDWVPRFGAEVWLCTAYKIDGKTVKIAPSSAYDLARAKPLYEKLPTWQEDIEGVRKFIDLPASAQKYIKFIESQIGIPITMIGVGPRHDQVILR
jgi:adenylosuccinate synthase